MTARVSGFEIGNDVINATFNRILVPQVLLEGEKKTAEIVQCAKDER